MAATRIPITIDLGDGKERPIRFKASYSKGLKEKYGTFSEMLQKVESEDLIGELLFAGFVDKSEFQDVGEIIDALDADRQLDIVNALLSALTGVPQRLMGDPAKNEPTPVIQ